MLPPESAAPQVVSREIGVGVDTLERWRAESLARPAKERVWTAAARLEAVITTAAMDDVNRPGIPRRPRASYWGTRRCHERQAVHGGVQGGSRQAGH